MDSNPALPLTIHGALGKLLRPPHTSVSSSVRWGSSEYPSQNGFDLLPYPLLSAEYAFWLICCSLLSLCTIRNSVGVGRAVSSSCVCPGEKGWPQIPQLRRTRAQPEPRATWFLVLQAQNLGGELGVSDCWPHLTPSWSLAKALSSRWVS